MASPTQTPAPIKGSWEALLDQAAHLDDNRNEEALTIFDKLITRLQKMPQKQLLDREQRLQHIFETACVRAVSLNNSLERFEDAVKHLDILHDIVADPDAKTSICQAKLRTFLMMDRQEDALAILSELPTPDDAPLQYITQKFSIQLDALNFEEAQQILDSIHQIIESEGYKSNRSEDERSADLAQFYSMSSILALELREWEKGIQAYRQAQKHSEAYGGEGAYLLYSNLVHRGQPVLALPIIEEETIELRRKYWEGLARYGMGETEEATKLWEEIVGSELSEADSQAYIDLVLTHYYLGDKQRIGVELILRMLKEAERPSWQLLFFAAIGWGLRDNKINMLVNLDHAIDQYRRDAVGRYLPWTLWPPVNDLLSAEMQAKVQPYFDAQDLKHYYNI